MPIPSREFIPYDGIGVTFFNLYPHRQKNFKRGQIATLFIFLDIL